MCSSDLNERKRDAGKDLPRKQAEIKARREAKSAQAAEQPEEV